MAIMILAISLLLNIILFNYILLMKAAWKDDVNKFKRECENINNTWHHKYMALVDEYELEVIDMEDDLK